MRVLPFQSNEPRSWPRGWWIASSKRFMDKSQMVTSTQISMHYRDPSWRGIQHTHASQDGDGTELRYPLVLFSHHPRRVRRSVWKNTRYRQRW